MGCSPLACCWAKTRGNPTAAAFSTRVALWRRDRRAGNGILIEGSPTGEMHHSVIRLVNRYSSCGGNLTSHARITYADLPCLEDTDDTAGHEHPTGLTNRIVHPVAEDPRHQDRPDESGAGVHSDQCTSSVRPAV
jgi:hypothetical protein